MHETRRHEIPTLPHEPGPCPPDRAAKAPLPATSVPPPRSYTFPSRFSDIFPHLTPTPGSPPNVLLLFFPMHLVVRHEGRQTGGIVRRQGVSTRVIRSVLHDIPYQFIATSVNAFYSDQDFENIYPVIMIARSDHSSECVSSLAFKSDMARGHRDTRSERSSQRPGMCLARWLHRFLFSRLPSILMSKTVRLSLRPPHLLTNDTLLRCLHESNPDPHRTRACPLQTRASLRPSRSSRTVRAGWS